VKTGTLPDAMLDAVFRCKAPHASIEDKTRLYATPPGEAESARKFSTVRLINRGTRIARKVHASGES
jgi:hypothetical protein